MKVIKKFFVTTFACTIGLLSLSNTAKTKEAKSILDDTKELIQEASDLFDSYYDPTLYYETTLNSLKQKKLALNSFNENRDEEESIQKDYWLVSIENIYNTLSDTEKESILNIYYENADFSIAYDILTGNYEANTQNEESDNESDIQTTNNLNQIKAKANSINVRIKKLIGVGSAAIAFSTITSLVAGINSSSSIPFVGWAIAAVLLASLIVFIVVNWSYIQDTFSSFISTLKSKFSRISNLLSVAESKCEKKLKIIQMFQKMLVRKIRCKSKLKVIKLQKKLIE